MKPRIILIVVTMLLVSFLQAQKVTSNYIAKFLPLAITLKETWGIPVSIILGVSILESGSGNYASAKGIWISRITNVIKKQALYKYDK